MKEKGAWSDGRGPLGTGGVTMKAARAAAVSAHLEGGAGLEVAGCARTSPHLTVPGLRHKILNTWRA